MKTSEKVDMKREIVDELHKSARINFNRRRVIVKGLNDLFQADLVDMIKYARYNKGFKYILTVINAFSKFAWAIPVKSKSAKDVTNAMRKIFDESFIPKNIQTDNGKEFYNKEFKQLMEKYNVNHYSTYSSMKASIVERFNRTLKSNMWKEFSYQGSYVWLKILPHLLQQYNYTRHSTTHMKPVDVNEKNEKQLLKTVYSNIKVANLQNKFNINDRVRISKYREQFSKGYTPNWSNEIFTIENVKMSNPSTYILRDDEGHTIKGAFYDEELQHTKHPNVQLIERIIRRKGNKILVKWLGFDSSHNSWIDKKHIV